MPEPKSAVFAPVAVTVLLAALFVSAANAAAANLTVTSDGSTEATVQVPAMGWNNSTSVTIPAGADVLSASLAVTGLPDGTDPESYPGTPGLSIGGAVQWKFEGPGNGLLGRQSEFVLPPTGDTVKVGPSTPAVLNVRMPAVAIVSDASIVVEGAGVDSPNLDAGADGIQEWTFTGAFSDVRTVGGLEGPMNDFLRNRAAAFPDAWGNRMTSVPLLFGAAGNGTLKVTGLRVMYEARLPVAGLGPALNAAAHAGGAGDTVVPLELFSDHRGRLRISNISIEYDRLPTATLRSPVSGAVLNSTAVQFGWISADPDGDPLTYFFNLRGPGGNRPTVQLSDTSYLAEGLEPGDYTWSVTPNDGFRNGTCLSGELTFRVVSSGTVPEVSLLDPVDGEAIVAGPVGLRWTQWSPASGEVSYRIYLDESDATTLLFELFGAANCSFVASNLPADRAYRWTVVPYVSEGGSTTKGICSSGIWGFTLGNASAGSPHPPRITSVPPASASVGCEYSYRVLATDPNGDRLTFSLLRFPAGMIIGFSSGLVVWTPEAGQTGDFPVTVSVSDGAARALQSFSVSVTSGTPPPPGVRLSYPKDGDRANRSLYIVGSVSSAPGAPRVRTVEVRLDAGPWQAADLSGDGWTFLLDTSESMNGPHTVAARAFDGTAYSSAVNITLTYDNPHSVLLDYPLSTGPSPIPFLIVVAIVLMVGPAGIYMYVKGRERRGRY